MAAEAEVNGLERLCSGATEVTEFGKRYVLLPKLQLPDGCTPDVVDALLCLDMRDGYATRLYFAQPVSCRNGLNWNTQNVLILQRNWFAYSWRVSPSARPIEILAQHLKALR